jgi:hypothetical protein
MLSNYVQEMNVSERIMHKHSKPDIDRPASLLSLVEVKPSREILTICAYCRKIESEQDTWESADHCVRNHSDAECSHGICPECLDALRGKFDRS